MVNRLSFSPGRTPNIAKVDPRLVEIVSAGATGLPPGYRVTINEGYNPAGHVPASQHHIAGRGALDVQIWDPSGNRILNKGNDPSGMYTRLAKSSYQYVQRNYPDLKGTFAWGGSFGTGRGSKTRDLMHFDLGGERGKLGPRLAQLGPPIPPADIPDTGRPNMYGLQGNRGDVNPAMRAYAESKGYNYVPVGTSGMTRAEQTAALTDAVKNDPNAKVIAFSQGGYAARDAIKQGAQIKEAMIIGAPGVEGQFPGVDATFIPQMAGVDHMALPAAVAKQYGGPAATAYTGGPPQIAAQQAAAGLAAAGTLRKGATDARTGGAVTRLQQQLAAVPGGPPVAVDGKYGPQTEAAVRAVEKQYRLTPDRGVAGPQVQAALAGNERMRIVADTQRRFGGPLAPGGFPLGVAPKGDLAARPYDSGSLYPGRTQAEVITAPPDPNAPPMVPPPSLQTGVARGAPRPAPPVAPGGPLQLSMPEGEAPLGWAALDPRGSWTAPPRVQQDITAPRQDITPPDAGGQFIGGNGVPPTAPGGPIDPQTLALLQRNVPSAPGSDPVTIFQREQLAAAMPGASAAKAASLPYPSMVAGRPDYPAPNTPRGSGPLTPTDFVAAAGAAGRGARDAALSFSDWAQRQFSGGPPTSTAAPRASAGPMPPRDIFRSAVPAPTGYGEGNQGPELVGGSNPYGGPPQQSSLGGTAGFVLSSLFGITPAYSAELPSGGPPVAATAADVAGGGYNLRPGTGSASGGPPLVNPGGPIIRSGGEFPASDLGQFAPAGDQTIAPAGNTPFFGTGALYGANADQSRLDAGTLDTTATGGVPVQAPGGVPYATDPMRRTAGFTNIGNGIVQTPAPHPSLGTRIARVAVPAAASMVPGIGPLLGMIARSAMRTGSFDNAQPYRGATGGNYATLMTSGGVPALTQWGTQQYSGPSGVSDSPFTPSGYTAPSFDPISGGPSYAYQPNGMGGGQYLDSQGRVHSY